MKTKSVTYISALLLLVSFGSLFAGIGSSGAQFMQIGSGLRAISMGSAYTAVAEGLDAIYWNPAGLATLNNKVYAGFNHTQYFADMTYENFAISTPFMNGVIGVFGMGLLSGDIEITTVDAPDGTGEFYDANDYAFGLSYSRQISNKFSAGISFKVINQNIAELSANGWSMDIGGMYRTGLLNNLRIGFAITNFGPDLRYTGDDLIFRTRVFKDEINQQEDSRAEYLTEEYQLPLKLQLGFAIDVINTDNQKIVLSFDGINPADQSEMFGAGVEYLALNTLALRLGYTTLNDKNFSAGVGLNLNTIDAKIDYAYERHQYLGDLHRFGFVFGF
jgi:hypothetical protein